MRGFRYWLSPPLRSRSIALRGLGYHESMLPGIVDRPAGTGDILIMLFHNPARIGTDIKANEYAKDHAIAWRAGAGHYYGDVAKFWKHTWIHCDGSAVRRVLRSTRLPMDRPIPLSDPMVVEQAVLALYEEIHSQVSPDPALVTNILDSLIRQMARQVSKTKPTVNAIPPAMLRVRHYIDMHFEEPMRLDDLAEQAEMSVSHLAAEFRRCYSMPPIEYMIRQRMQRAAYLLLDRNLTVTQVAERVGYDDPFHFSKLFKKHHGQSPKHYRAAINP